MNESESGRQLGFWMCLALVVGNMIGSGVFLLPASLGPYGGMAIIGWLVSAAGAVCLALVFARLGRILPLTGGPYAYTRVAFGDFGGFLVAWSYWISMWTTDAALAVAFVSYLTVFWPALAEQPPLAAGSALAAIWLLTAVNLMLFALLHNPCATTIITIYKETLSARWAALGALMPLAVAFIVTFLMATAARLLGW